MKPMKHLIISVLLAIIAGPALAYDCDAEYDRIDSVVNRQLEIKDKIVQSQSDLDDEKSVLRGLKRDIDEQKAALRQYTGLQLNMSIDLVNSSIRHFQSLQNDYNQHVARHNAVIDAKQATDRQLRADFNVWTKECSK